MGTGVRTPVLNARQLFVGEHSKYYKGAALVMLGAGDCVEQYLVKRF